jgi:peptidoglycan/xylan/chitin deacetylase (PgdA/CDA1 family)
LSRKALVTSVATKLGLPWLLEQAGTRRPSLAVLVYHRILNPADSRYDPAVIEATPDQFDDQMATLRRRHAAVDPEELCDLIENPSKVKHFRIAITFDDGYRDNFTNAFPILRSHGLSAMFFVPTHFIGTKRIPWWDQIAWVVRNTKKTEVTFEFPQKKTFTIDQANPASSIQQIIRLFSKAGNVDQDKFLAEVERACALEIPKEADEAQFFSWEEADEMQKGGMAIGSHTHSHRILNSLSADEQKKECTDSGKQLKERGFARSDCLAYPVGNLTSFSDETIRYAKEAGYRFAFSNFGGLNAPGKIEPMNVRRMGMDIAENATQFRFRLGLSAVAGKEVW